MAQLHSVPTLQKPTLSAQVARHLLDLIAQEGLRPGDLVPSEVQICKQLCRSAAAACARRIGRSPRSASSKSKAVAVRACRRSTRTCSRRFSVTHSSTAQVNATHVIETRRAIEVQGAQLAARNVTEAQKVSLNEPGRPDALGARRARSRAPRQRRHGDSHDARGSELQSAQSVAAGRAACAARAGDAIDLGNRRSESELIRIVDAHEAIVERVCAGDAVGAGAAMAMHFDLSVASSSNERARGSQSPKSSARVLRMTYAAVQQAIEHLRADFGARLSVGAAVREQHGRGEAFAQSFPPDAVIWPESTGEGQHDPAHVPRAARSRDRVRRRHLARRSRQRAARRHLHRPVAHGPGAGRPRRGRRLRRAARRHARGAQHLAARHRAVLPGRSRRQCDARRHDLHARVRHDDGSLRHDRAQRARARSRARERRRSIRCGNRARKSSAGYDLVRLFTGAEGTLGIITEATLRLYGQPEAVGSGVCSFPDLRGAVESVIELIQSGAPLARIEFLDDVQVRACNAYSKTVAARAADAVHRVSRHRRPASPSSSSARRRSCARTAPPGSIGRRTSSSAQQLWRARHAAYFAALGLRPGCECVVADVCVPISALAECVAAARARDRRAGLIAPIVGHVGDGNFHVLFLLEPGNADERARMERVYDAMIDACASSRTAPARASTASALGKRDKLVAEFGEPVVELMRRLKEAWDPHDILNPGKVFQTT